LSKNKVSKSKTTRPDIATFAGLVLALGGILGGLLLEKGSLLDIAQYTAALIVFGGTLGAVMVTTPLSVLKAALAQIKAVFFETSHSPAAMITDIVQFATKARKHGIVSLEMDAEAIADPFLRKAVNLAVDGTDLDEMRSMMELEIDLLDHRAEEVAKVFDAAGGYSPTVGIIGAVMGLIQVMKNLSNIEMVGHGIAVAFVATVYGVGAANLLLLPAAGKIRARAANDRQHRELALDGVLGIIEGANPKLIKAKLDAYLDGEDAKPKSNDKAKKAPEAKAA
jgi:chemotaxis protein MotA